ncbi:hypothetical protein ABIA32_006574 [Streptacidiphilus sp. MAP12-20]|uniref:hypothetical protein n=1 Tax=Streptacidiphilus sp. MAP12-20 TaxID=3156299 RepID=UPI003516AF53
MDIVYASLTRRQQAGDGPAPVAEVGEVVDVLWAHAGPEDHLEHAGGRIEADRVDLLLFFLPPDSASADSAEQRAAALLHRAHHASPLLQRRYLPPPELDPARAHDTRPTP